MLCQQMFSFFFFFTKSAYKLHLRLFLFIHGKSIQHVPTNKINLKKFYLLKAHHDNIGIMLKHLSIHFSFETDKKQPVHLLRFCNLLQSIVISVVITLLLNQTFVYASADGAQGHFESHGWPGKAHTWWSSCGSSALLPRLLLFFGNLLSFITQSNKLGNYVMSLPSSIFLIKEHCA